MLVDCGHGEAKYTCVGILYQISYVLRELCYSVFVVILGLLYVYEILTLIQRSLEFYIITCFFLLITTC